MDEEEINLNLTKALVDIISLVPVTVTFTKVNGEERVMRCTSNLILIPEESHPKAFKEGEEAKPKNEDTIVAFDLEKQGWRSFRKDSVISYSLT